jgi:hypothetical protein
MTIKYRAKAIPRTFPNIYFVPTTANKIKMYIKNVVILKHKKVTQNLHKLKYLRKSSDVFRKSHNRITLTTKGVQIIFVWTAKLNSYNTFVTAGSLLLKTDNSSVMSVKGWNSHFACNGYIIRPKLSYITYTSPCISYNMNRNNHGDHGLSTLSESLRIHRNTGMPSRASSRARG